MTTEPDKQPRPSDAVVSVANGVAWMNELVIEQPLDLASRLAEFEPAVIGCAVRLADQAKQRLLRVGASPDIAELASWDVLRAGVICFELHRRGHATAWAHLWGSADKGGDGDG